MPDISFFKPLCEILGISVNELVIGEKISKEKLVSSLDETIIHTLNTSKKNQKKSKTFIKLLLISLMILMIILCFILIYYKNSYPKINIYSLVVFLKDEDYQAQKQFTYKKDNHIHNVYYYGIDSALLCNSNKDCYEVKMAIAHNQTSVSKIKEYLEQQYELGTLDRFTLYDGGTTIYENSRYSAIFCDNLKGNQDIYVGESNMVEALNGEYCGHTKIAIKEFIRTYHIVSILEDEKDNEFIDVTLKQEQGKETTVKIHNSINIMVGRDYEFSFYTFDMFDDTIENIFKYATIVKVRETDKIGKEQMNESICINEKISNGAELNELEHVAMTIEEGTLTKNSAKIIITDLSGKYYDYGSWFRIDKKENGVWKELEKSGENFAFNVMAYKVDKNHKLEMIQNWSHMYHPLEAGYYRLVKEVDEKYFSVEFTID